MFVRIVDMHVGLLFNSSSRSMRISLFDSDSVAVSSAKPYSLIKPEKRLSDDGNRISFKVENVIESFSPPSHGVLF